MIRHVKSLAELNEQEKMMVDVAFGKYGEVYKNTLDVYHLIEQFIVKYRGSIDDCVILFLRFYYTGRNSFLRAIFSTVRLHHTQASADLREFLEYGADAGYSIANPIYTDFVKDDEAKILEIPKPLKVRRMKWLDKNYPARSEDLKRIKLGPQHSMHSNFIDTHRVVDVNLSDPKNPQIYTSYFDFNDDYVERASLWQIANAGLAVLGLIYEINRDLQKFDIIESFEKFHADLMKSNLRIRDELTETERFKRADKLSE